MTALQTTHTQMLSLLEKKSPEIASLCKRYGVSQLVLFGSAARQDDFNPDASDIDFLVEFETDSSVKTLEQYFELRSDLSILLGHPVDLVGLDTITNPYLLKSINKHREVVYAA